MPPPIVSIPRELMKVTVTNWRIRWGAQTSGSDTGGGDQAIVTPFPRFVGQPQVVMGAREVRAWQAILDMGQGRANLYRVPMIERMKSPFDRGEIPATGIMDLTAADMTARRAIEPRPTVRCSTAALAGSSFIIVDESNIVAPIPVGWILSHDDWPFRVKYREAAPSGMTKLGVSFVRRTIPVNAQIDIFATGLFRDVSDEGSFPELGGDMAAITMSFEEYITR